MAGIDYSVTDSTTMNKRDYLSDYMVTGAHWKEKDYERKIIYKVLSDTRIYDRTSNKLYFDTDTSGSLWREFKYDHGTTNTYNTSYWNDLRWNDMGGNSVTWCPPVAPGDRIRKMIRDRMSPAIHRNKKRQPMSFAADIREERARQTLRRIIGAQAYKKFIRDGFITVVPKSGLTYRIYPGHGITEVYDKGIMVDRLCVVLQGNFPPTDSILMRYLLILNDEGEFSKYAVKHGVWGAGKSFKLVLPAAEAPPLTIAWAKSKEAWAKSKMVA